MARETLRDQIERLKQENSQLKEQRDKAWEENQELTRRLYEREEGIEEEFKQTALYKQIERDIKQLQTINSIDKKAIENLQSDKIKLIERLEGLQKLINEQKERTHNERGAGRKRKFTSAEIKQIKQMYAEGHSMREIAKNMSCSAGLVCKLINEQN